LTALRQAAIKAGIDPDGDAAFSLFVDLAGDTINTGWQAARLAEDAAREVVELHARRHAITAAAGMVDGLRTGGDPAGMVEGWAATLERVREAGTAGRQAGVLTFAEVATAWESHQETPVIRTGCLPFDLAMDGGLPVGGVTALAAEPGLGKSAMALQWVLGALLNDPELRVVWGLGEMTPQAFGRRAACVGAQLLGLPAVTMRAAGGRADAAKSTMRELAGAIGDRLTVVQAPLTVDRLEREVVNATARLAVVDYLQLMGGDGADRVGELEALAGRLRQLAIAREAAVVIVSSVAKSTGRPGSPARVGTVCKGAAEIDYMVEFLFHGERDGEPDEHGIVSVNWACRKARNARRTDVTLRLDGAIQYFYAVDPAAVFATWGMEGGE
jgi:replicative DNA helicase